MVMIIIIEGGISCAAQVYMLLHLECGLLGCTESGLRLWVADIAAEIVSIETAGIGLCFCCRNPPPHPRPRPRSDLNTITRLAFFPAPNPPGNSSILVSLVVPVPLALDGVFSSKDLMKTPFVQAEEEKDINVPVDLSAR